MIAEDTIGFPRVAYFCVHGIAIEFAIAEQLSYGLRFLNDALQGIVRRGIENEFLIFNGDECRSQFLEVVHRRISICGKMH